MIQPFPQQNTIHTQFTVKSTYDNLQNDVDEAKPSAGRVGEWRMFKEMAAGSRSHQDSNPYKPKVREA